MSEMMKEEYGLAVARAFFYCCVAPLIGAAIKQPSQKHCGEIGLYSFLGALVTSPVIVPSVLQLLKRMGFDKDWGSSGGAMVKQQVATSLFHALVSVQLGLILGETFVGVNKSVVRNENALEALIGAAVMVALEFVHSYRFWASRTEVNLFEVSQPPHARPWVHFVTDNTYDAERAMPQATTGSQTLVTVIAEPVSPQEGDKLDAVSTATTSRSTTPPAVTVELAQLAVRPGTPRPTGPANSFVSPVPPVSPVLQKI